jgi:hypothetical protein
VCVCVYCETQIFANRMSMLSFSQVYEGKTIKTCLSGSQVTLKRLFCESVCVQTRSKEVSTFHTHTHTHTHTIFRKVYLVEVMFGISVKVKSKVYPNRPRRPKREVEL